MDFQKFKDDLSALMNDQKDRPFVCDGPPLNASVFIVGLNPATVLRKSFWDYCDESGFNRKLFEQDYLGLRTKTGNRPRIEAIAGEFPKGACLETNIYSVPTKKASYLRSDQKRFHVFQYLLQAIRPSVFFIHSVPAVNFFVSLNRDLAGVEDGVAVRTTIMERDVTVMLRRRNALYTMALADARRCGEELAKAAGMNFM